MLHVKSHSQQAEIFLGGNTWYCNNALGWTEQCELEMNSNMYCMEWLALHHMGLLPDMFNCRFRMRQECRERFPRHWLQRKALVSDPACITACTYVTRVPWCMSGMLTRGQVKRSRHSRRMRNPQFYVSGKRPIALFDDRLLIVDPTVRIWSKNLFVLGVTLFTCKLCSMVKLRVAHAAGMPGTFSATEG